LWPNFCTYKLFTLHMYYTLFLLKIISVIIYSERYKLWSTSLRNFSNLLLFHPS
jgi:hypothetical protein